MDIFRSFMHTTAAGMYVLDIAERFTSLTFIHPDFPLTHPPPSVVTSIHQPSAITQPQHLLLPIQLLIMPKHPHAKRLPPLTREILLDPLLVRYALLKLEDEVVFAFWED